MRAGILESLRPFFVEGDSFSGVLMHTIKRMLQKADVVDLTNVLISADGFITEMRPFLDEYEQSRDKLIAEARNNQTHPQVALSNDDISDDRGYDADSGGPTDGPGDTGWEDEIREVHSTLVHHPDFLQAVPTTGESVDNRHEASVAGNNGSHGGTGDESVS
jgi:hypothetical protein